MAKTGDVGALIAVIRDGEGKDRAAALLAIIDCMETHADRVKEVRESLLAVSLPLVRDPTSHVRSAALGVVTARRDPSAPSLSLAALSDPAPGVRVTGLLGVFHLQPAGSLSSVMRLLDDEDPWVRRFAVGTMERVGDRSSVASLLQAREREEDPTVRDSIDEVVAIFEGRHPPTPIESFMEDPGS
jgi:HEAT repeat protein